MTLTRSHSHHREAGNVFFALFGTIVLLGALGATVSTFIKGPLSSSVQITRANGAETQMAVITQLITMQAASTPNCDADPVVEPIIWRLASGTEPRPINGGLVPNGLGVASTKDPWGTEFGYCVWDHGANSCGSAQRLAGTATNPDAQTVIAIISAGPDKKFTTTCRTSAAAALANLPLVAKAASTDDDIIYTYSYAEAAGASGGLWAIKSSDANTATIGKNLAVGGGAIFSGAGTFSEIKTDSISARSKDFIVAEDGFRVPDATVYNYTCNAALAGVMRRKNQQLEICVNSRWTDITGTSGNPSAASDSAAACNAGTLGRARYNPTTTQLEFCNGTNWTALVTQGSAGALIVNPSYAEDITVTGPCYGSGCPYAIGNAQHFVITNISAATTGELSVEESSREGTFVSLLGCTGDVLAPGETCMITAIPSASGNGDFYTNIEVSVGGLKSLNIPLKITGTGFTCVPGMYGWGGLVVSCANSTTPAYVLNEAGCDGTKILEPDCDGKQDQNNVRMQNSFGFVNATLLNSTSGGRNTANAAGYGDTQAFGYCRNLVKGGYDDWYLPSLAEWAGVITLNRQKFKLEDGYWTSTFGSYNQAGDSMINYNPQTRTSATSYDPNNLPRVRCMRQHGAAPFLAEKDTTPTLVNLNVNPWRPLGLNLGMKFSITASQAMVSDTYMVNGINTPIPIDISAGWGVSINGGAQITSGTVNNGDQLRFYGNGPASTGAETRPSIKIGTDTYSWGIYYPAAATRRVFVTTANYNGNLGVNGFWSARTTCQNIGGPAFGGQWIPILSDGINFAKNRLPRSWNRVENLGSELIAYNIDDLFDGSLENPVRYNQSGQLATSRRVWTGMGNAVGDTAEYVEIDATQSACGTWRFNSFLTGYDGSVGAKNLGAFYSGTSGCAEVRGLYCMGPF